MLFSHTLTKEQEKEAYASLGVGNIYCLPAELRDLWSQVPPQLPQVADYVQPIKVWLTNRIKQGDYLLIQGDFGATFLMVKWAFSQKCKPLYATTKREVVESYSDEEVHITRTFKHIRFRFYEQG
ncbi:MAG: hypothetical protein GX273_08150 [Bacteroidales bacterium]|nr:hypothetical protein [Bacteroidales bacterium]